ncbi:MAG: hypothetical protein VYB10_05580 [Actinomycetota bacterium]|nr:hypothetical protein [Acidimicrobiales bacterium]MEE2806552.1 hypothetical protein [Actinomycetota bacterium]|tara:strand:- start:2822 stop:3361 length:540 start_codon:yes stop_codon:yes gene_type:complete
MIQVSVKPESFEIVFYDAAVIGEVVAEVAGRLGVDEAIALDIEEASPLGRSKILSYDPIALWVDGGALENTQRPRNFGRARARDTIGRLLLRVLDRRSGRFDDAPTDDELDMSQFAAWDVHSVGRLERIGVGVQRKRRLYQFRNRHGFTDAADAAFEELWGSSELSWAEIDRISGGCRT